MQIRNYKDEDFPQLDRLLTEAGIKWVSIDKREIFKKKIEQDPESIIVAEEDKKIIGTIFFVYDAWAPYILHLAVDSNHREKGIGSILFQTAEQRLRARKTETVFGIIREENQKVLKYCTKKGYNALAKVYHMIKKF